MTDLAAFLEARISEDEKAADALSFACRDPRRRPDFSYAGGPAAEQFWERNDPARALRECEAMRAILGRYEFERALADRDPKGVTTMSKVAVGTLLPVLEHLAAVWSDHPDYRAEWTP